MRKAVFDIFYPCLHLLGTLLTCEHIIVPVDLVQLKSFIKFMKLIWIQHLTLPVGIACKGSTRSFFKRWIFCFRSHRWCTWRDHIKYQHQEAFSPPLLWKCCCRMKAAVSRTVYVFNFSLPPLLPKGAGVTTLQSESVYLQAEHTRAPPRFPMELLQLSLSCVEEQKHALDFTGGGCQYNLFIIYIKKEILTDDNLKTLINLDTGLHPSDTASTGTCMLQTVTTAEHCHGCSLNVQCHLTDFLPKIAQLQYWGSWRGKWVAQRYYKQINMIHILSSLNDL